ncbi:hypothetical protein TD95_005183 [Thielaviopsis punctulata]|uniref:SET domain-containing protein n=1 Tax=Thielaviopsis punctulata TaxID=72032 RepID=A0A0F4ZHE8_9PEZI|nr:hypothetical protein TD95_005183 [Thielaviopsis punctulata]
MDYDKLLELAERNGIKLNGIAPQQIPGRGSGMVAQRAIKPREIILTVPNRTFRSRDTVASSIRAALPADVSAHGMLAAEILLDASPDFEAWKSVFPSRADFESCMPLLWAAELQALLPVVCREKLVVQRRAVAADWAAVRGALEGRDEAEYRYAWLLVNTRAFYNGSARMRRRPHGERLALQPVVDLVNHTAGAACAVAFGPVAFTVAADRAYAAGEEVLLSYGAHANDYLLAEYGFILDDNAWDEVCLDDVVAPLFTAEQAQALKDRDFWGRYVVDRSTAGCYRTQVALRIKLLARPRWERVVAGLDEAEDVQYAVDGLLRVAMAEYRQTAEQTVQRLGEMQEGTAEQRELLGRRWRQIIATLDVVGEMVAEDRV